MKASDYPKGEAVEISEPKTCDIHHYVLGGPDVPALYDGKTDQGSWANMCESCFRAYGLGLGLGLGQRLIVVPVHATREVRDPNS